MGLSETEFQRNINALIANILVKKKRLLEKTQEYWGQIVPQLYEFNRGISTLTRFLIIINLAQTDADLIKRLRKQELLDFVETFVTSRAPERRKLAIHVWSDAHAGLRNEPYQDFDAIVINDPSEFAAAMELYPSIVAK